ncbi:MULTISPECIES: fimbrial protein [unclassified Serratia (in: enterobacteria)]|uniref:fimbrial protein n=1 Tax=unclassified Serratia (in: enterobacteria) TaxID=2647522 RepID=UPI0009E06618|nr:MULTISPECIES: fimbrial protein [unclassified Serratia (in: enterobacteria)]
MIKKIVFPKIRLVLGLLAFSQLSHAAVTCTTEGPSAFTISSSTITVQRDQPINSPISDIIYGNSYNNIFTCLNPEPTDWSVLGIATTLPYSTTIDGKRIYSTNMPGVGIAIGTSGSYWISNGLSLWGDVNGRIIFGARGPVFYNFSAHPSVQFYKIGPISSGTISEQQTHTLKVGQDDGSYIGPSIPVNLSAIQVNVIACSINNPVIQVPLDDVNINEFSGVNSTLKPKDFSVGLNCDAGAKINVTMTGTKNTDTTADGVLKLTNAGTPAVATGVGIQILYNSAPLVLNNMLALKTSEGGQETFPFTAQYYQTTSKVTGGVANSTMTLNITYQ